MGETT